MIYLHFPQSFLSSKAINAKNAKIILGIFLDKNGIMK
jgi:hypothetical protein